MENIKVGLTQINIMNTCGKLDKSHLDTVMKWLISNHVKVSEGADGSRVNLSILDPETLKQLDMLTAGLYSVQSAFTNKID